MGSQHSGQPHGDKQPWEDRGALRKPKVPGKGTLRLQEHPEGDRREENTHLCESGRQADRPNRTSQQLLGPHKEAEILGRKYIVSH